MTKRTVGYIVSYAVVIVVVVILFVVMSSATRVQGQNTITEGEREVNMSISKGEMVYCMWSKNENKSKSILCDAICCIDKKQFTKIDQYLEGYMK